MAVHGTVAAAHPEPTFRSAAAGPGLAQGWNIVQANTRSTPPQGIDAVRPIRDDIEERVRRLLTELAVTAVA